MRAQQIPLANDPTGNNTLHQALMPMSDENKVHPISRIVDHVQIRKINQSVGQINHPEEVKDTISMITLTETIVGSDPSQPSKSSSEPSIEVESHFTLLDILPVIIEIIMDVWATHKTTHKGVPVWNLAPESIPVACSRSIRTS